MMVIRVDARDVVLSSGLLFKMCFRYVFKRLSTMIVEGHIIKIFGTEFLFLRQKTESDFQYKRLYVNTRNCAKRRVESRQ